MRGDSTTCSICGEVAGLFESVEQDPLCTDCYLGQFAAPISRE